MDEQEIQEVTEDSQILEETVLNERLVTHPQWGEVRLSMPTLKTQRKIDAISRSRKKMLLNSFDEIPGSDGETVRMPAHPSHETLRKQYLEAGWWTEEREQEMDEASDFHVDKLAYLESLGFESEEECDTVADKARVQLFKIFEAEEEGVSDELEAALAIVTDVGVRYDVEAETEVRAAAPSTEVDDILQELSMQREMYHAYVELIEAYNALLAIQSEHTSLFMDSWQEQLKYYIRLAQVHYCIERVETGESLWPSVEAMELEEDSELIGWAFNELSAYWQGLTDESRERMKKYDFIYGRSGRPESSDDSPDLQESKTDGEPAASELISSTEDSDTTETSPKTT
ncbi:MAG: hypothetical protein KOO63_03890 [Bacteroidales bacterium]|nr:hypothetical protein [Candidatus Latescibacterota bacterium]